MTTKSHSYPTRIKLQFGGKEGWVVLDQIRTVDRKRIVKILGTLETKIIIKIKEKIQEMLVD